MRDVTSTAQRRQASAAGIESGEPHGSVALSVTSTRSQGCSVTR